MSHCVVSFRKGLSYFTLPRCVTQMDQGDGEG